MRPFGYNGIFKGLSNRNRIKLKARIFEVPAFLFAKYIIYHFYHFYHFILTNRKIWCIILYSKTDISYCNFAIGAGYDTDKKL